MYYIYIYICINVSICIHTDVYVDLSLCNTHGQCSGKTALEKKLQWKILHLILILTGS